jgi:Mg2+/Co2+ transporter CorB
MIFLLLILLALSALFSSSETAFASVNKIRLRAKAEQGDKRAATALQIAERYEDALTAILVGNNIANIGSSSLATVLFTQWVGDIGPAVATVVMTLLVLTFCEVLPKSYAKSHAETLALHFASALSAFTLLMTPFVKFFHLLSLAFKPKTEAPSVTEDELKYIMMKLKKKAFWKNRKVIWCCLHCNSMKRPSMKFSFLVSKSLAFPVKLQQKKSVICSCTALFTVSLSMKKTWITSLA